MMKLVLIGGLYLTLTLRQRQAVPDEMDDTNLL